MRKRHVSPLRFGLVALASMSFLVACGSDDDSGSSEPAESEAEGTAPEDNIVPAADVATGYADMLAAMTALSADPVSATDEALDEVHETWESFEGTVKSTDQDAYLASEEALDSFLEAGKDGNAVAMGEATAKMTETSAAYLAANPG